MKRKLLSILLAICTLSLLTVGCSKNANDGNNGYKITNIVGTSSDYSDSNNWLNIPEITKNVDTVYIYPTVYSNPDPDAPQIVPIDNETMRQGAQSMFAQQASVFEQSTNVFAPYYRQSNLVAIMNKADSEFMAFQSNEQRTDVYGALDYYFDHYNQGRPFILAGHSQGSVMVKMALIDYFKAHPELLNRMVASYIIGFSVTGEDLATNTALKFAEGADDTGVIVSWNTEGPENKNEANIVVKKNAMSINPINWKRDNTYASTDENLGSYILNSKTNEIETIKPGLADAQIDTERGVVVCTTMPEYYITMEKFSLQNTQNPFGSASLHSEDYGAYYYNIQENVKTRINAYMAKNK